MVSSFEVSRVKGTYTIQPAAMFSAGRLPSSFSRAFPLSQPEVHGENNDKEYDGPRNDSDDNAHLWTVSLGGRLWGGCCSRRHWYGHIRGRGHGDCACVGSTQKARRIIPKLNKKWICLILVCWIEVCKDLIPSHGYIYIPRYYRGLGKYALRNRDSDRLRLGGTWRYWKYLVIGESIDMWGLGRRRGGIGGDEVKR